LEEWERIAIFATDRNSLKIYQDNNETGKDFPAVYMDIEYTATV